MESGNQTSDIDSDGDQNIASFTKLSLHPPIDTDKENEVIIISQTSNHKQRKKLAKLLKRYTENKEMLIRKAKDLYKVSSILRREKRQTICFKEYGKLDEQQDICELKSKNISIIIPLTWRINIMEILSEFSIEELDRLNIRIKSNCENKHEDIEELLLSFGSTQMKEFNFSGYSIEIKNENLNSGDEFSSYYEVFPCFSYFYGLRDAMSKATKSISINDILLNSKEFSAILRAAKHVKQLYFNDCKILTDDECELGEMEGCQIEYLEIGNYNNVYKCSRDYDDSWMKIFLSIVGCPNLLKSLSLNGIRFDYGEEMMKKLLSRSKEILGNDYDMLMPSFDCLYTKLNYIIESKIKAILYIFNKNSLFTGI